MQDSREASPAPAFIKRKKNTGITVAFALLCALGVSLPRLPGSSGTIVFLAGIPFSYTDAFMFLAGGIGGLPAGILAFSISFLMELFKPNSFYSLYTMSAYLLLMLVAALISYRRSYAGLWKLPFITLAMALLLVCSWQLTVVHARVRNIYSDLPFHILLASALPETLLAVLIQKLYFRFAPDRIKERLGSGWKYTKAYQQTGGRRRSILGAKMLAMSFLSTMATSAIVILLATMQQHVGTGITPQLIFSNGNLRLLLLSACVSFPLAYAANVFSQHTVARPLNQMSFLMEQYFSTDGGSRFSQLPDLGIRSHDEIATLYGSLQKMLHDMAGYMEAEAQKRQLEADLQVAKAAGKAKSDFLSSMSHEIRTPINAVLGLDEMILRESREEAVRKYAQDIQSSGRMLLSIINDILDFSKIEAGKMEIVPAEYSTGDMIGDLVNMIAARAEAKGLLLHVNAAPDLPRKLFGDDNRIKQCVLNLLTNAVKYTREGSVTLDISFSPAGENRIRLTAHVIDTGIGIKEEDIKKLWSPFERIEEGRNRNIEGTGLGMSIVKGLTASMGGEISVRSEYGKGSDFSFSLEQEVRDGNPMGDWRPAAGAGGKERSAPGYEESFQAPEARILIVDDTPLNLTVIKGLLKATRIQIDTASDGEAGLAMAKATPYCAILIDHLMPKMDGIQMLSALRQDESSANRNTPCVALTANAISGARERYLEAGFTDYLSKPVDPKLLESMLCQLLPQGLVIRRGEAGFIESGAPLPASDSGGVSDEIFRDLFGMDIGKAIENCGDKDIFIETAKIFQTYTEENAGKIESFSASGDWKNYTILVHALKSSARLMGMEKLSDDARRLEELGKKAQENDGEAVTLITEATPSLLESYRSYGMKLRSLMSR